MSTNTPSIPVTRPRLVAVNRQQMVMRAIDVELLIDEDHSARSIWELVGRLDLSLYYAAIASVEGRAGREHTDPQVLISLWLYAYSRGISSSSAQPSFRRSEGSGAHGHRSCPAKAHRRQSPVQWITLHGGASLMLGNRFKKEFASERGQAPSS